MFWGILSSWFQFPLAWNAPRKPRNWDHKRMLNPVGLRILANHKPWTYQTPTLLGKKFIDVGFATNIRVFGVIASSTLRTSIGVNWKLPLKGEWVTLTHQRDNFGPRTFMLKNTFTTQGKNTLWSSLYIWALLTMSYCATSEALAVPSWHFLLLEPYNLLYSSCKKPVHLLR